MVRAVFDTSIFVRMVLGKPTTLVGKLRTAFEQEQFELVLSPPLLDEVVETLKSPFLYAKLGWSEEAIQQFASDLSMVATMVPGTLALNIPQLATRDPEDIKVVVAAVEGKTSFLVTQDKDLLALGRYRGVHVVEPPEFYRVLKALCCQG